MMSAVDDHMTPYRRLWEKWHLHVLATEALEHSRERQAAIDEAVRRVAGHGSRSCFTKMIRSQFICRTCVEGVRHEFQRILGHPCTA